MQNIALLLLLAVTASMIFSFDASVFAQETPEEEAMSDEMTEDTMDEEAMEEEMMEDTMEEDVDSPLEQMASGVEPHEIQCKAGQVLVFKASNWRPACVSESSFNILTARGWVASHDPTHEELTMMKDDYMAAHPEMMEDAEEEAMEEAMEETMEETEEEMMEEEVMEEEMSIDEETTDEGTETEGQTQQQSYTVNLSESMEMGAQ